MSRERIDDACMSAHLLTGGQGPVLGPRQRDESGPGLPSVSLQPRDKRNTQQTVKTH